MHGLSAVPQSMDEVKEAPMEPTALTEGEAAILKRLQKKPLDLRWGRNGWCPCGLPKQARRADFDSLVRRNPALVRIELGMLMLI